MIHVHIFKSLLCIRFLVICLVQHPSHGNLLKFKLSGITCSHAFFERKNLFNYSKTCKTFIKQLLPLFSHIQVISQWPGIRLPIIMKIKSEHYLNAPKTKSVLPSEAKYLNCRLHRSENLPMYIFNREE